MKRIFIALSLILCMAAPSVSVAAYPDKPIKLLVTASAGGLLDLAARVAANSLSKELGQPVLIANVPGGGGNVAINQFLAAKNDGYTLLVVTSPQITFNPTVMKVRFKYEDFRILGALAEQRIGIITQPDRDWKDLRDAFAWAKKENRPLVAGVMNEEDKEIMLRLGKQEGVNVSPVPQGGGSACLTSVMGGHTDVGCIGLIFVESALAGKVKALACESENRFTKLPEVPTLMEMGYGISQETVFLLIGRENMPKEAAEKIEQAMAKIGASPEYHEQVFERLQLEATPADAASAKAFVDRIYKNVLANYAAK